MMRLSPAFFSGMMLVGMARIILSRLKRNKAIPERTKIELALERLGEMRKIARRKKKTRTAIRIGKEIKKLLAEKNKREFAKIFGKKVLEFTPEQNKLIERLTRLEIICWYGKAFNKQATSKEAVSFSKERGFSPQKKAELIKRVGKKTAGQIYSEIARINLLLAKSLSKNH